MEPFGVGNPKPLFAVKDVIFRNISIFGNSRNVFKCDATDASGKTLPAVYFGDADGLAGFFHEHGRVKLLYSVEINEYRGIRSLQIRIEHYC